MFSEDSLLVNALDEACNAISGSEIHHQYEREMASFELRVLHFGRGIEKNLGKMKTLFLR
jgi:hypothetical protein